MIERRFLQHHRDEKCSLQEIECKMSHAGCQAKMKRQEMKTHMEAKKDEHLEMFSAKCKEYERELRELKLVISQIAPNPVFIPPSDIVMNNFEKFKNDDTRWYGPPFYTHVGGYKMCLGIDANGWGDGVGTHVGVAVHMMKGEFDSYLKWPFTVEITVQLVNQKEGGENIETMSDSSGDTFQRVTEGDQLQVGSGRGYGQFISHTDLYNLDEGKEYLKNDALILKITEVAVTI